MRIFLLAALIYSQSPVLAKVPETKLKLIRALPINGIEDPSGLTIQNGKLFAVSDKDDKSIYEINIKTDSANAFVKVELKDCPLLGALDFEGLSSYRDGFAIVSEKKFAVLFYRSDGSFKSLVQLPKSPIVPLFETLGAGPEGLAMLNGETIVVTGERQPAGILICKQHPVFRLFDKDENYPRSKTRPVDATGLSFKGHYLLCLSRNAEAFACIDTRDPEYPVKHILSFSQHKATFSYVDNTFGVAEGVAADDDYIYVVLDNNRMERTGGPSDRRPMLLLLELPEWLKIAP